MKKNGFTLVELLAVIAIIGILSVLVLPNIFKVSENINERLLSNKIEDIKSAAKLYAEANPDIFGASDEALIYVQTLVEEGFVNGDEKCDDNYEFKTDRGCVTDPTSDKPTQSDNLSNATQILIKKENVGYSVSLGEKSTVINSKKLVIAVCKNFENGTFKGASLNTGNACSCSVEGSGDNVKAKLSGISGNDDACIITGNNVNNWLRYGDSSVANWRVTGLYQYNKEVVTKMITANPID